ncbi:MAG: aldehyde dehydrogenase family protein, partial [Deltaproteobacteria bacterium]|nr:aldehyde dehydrogenase family protein [Deltaproteobacteria bacterium]
MTSAAIVAGNTVVVKPSERSPVTAARYVEVLEQAGLPSGVVNLVYGASVEGTYLTNHSGIDMVAFTGSKGTGLKIYRAAAEAAYAPERRNIKKTVTEMGGDNGAIVDADADIDDAIRYVGQSAFGYQGQKCSKLSRVLIHRSRYDEFVARFRSYVQSLRIGNPIDPGIDLSALIDERALATVRDEQVGLARERLQSTEFFEFEGPLPETGFYFRPTVILDPPPDDDVVQQEAFAPVVSIIPYDTFDEAKELFNGTEYGLTGGYIGRNPAHKARFIREARAGNLYVNRRITGARVGIEWFGSDIGMSGVGRKSGGPHYLRQFMKPVAGSAVAKPKRTYSSLEQVPQRLRDRSERVARQMAKKGAGRYLDEVLRTVDAAQVKWGERSVQERSDRLKKLAHYLSEHQEELAAILATEQGLSFTDANRQIESAVAEIWRIVEDSVKGLASHPTGILPGEETTAHYHPKGVGLLMTSQGTTLPTLAAIVSASLVAGNAVVVSSMDDNPLLAFWMTEAVRAAGLPKDLVLFQPNDPAQPTSMAGHSGFSFVAHDGTAQQGARLFRETVVNLEERGRQGVATFIGVPYDVLPTEAGFVHGFVSERVVSENQMRNGANLAQSGGGKPPTLPPRGAVVYRSSPLPTRVLKDDEPLRGPLGSPILSGPSDMVRGVIAGDRGISPEVSGALENGTPRLPRLP